MPKLFTLVLTVAAIATSLHSPKAQALKAQGCALPWGGFLADGDALIAWNYQTPPHGTHCQSEIRSCEGGFLTGSYTSPHCSEPARFFENQPPLVPQLVRQSFSQTVLLFR